MTEIKSFSVGRGDMFYINHSSSNFTSIDCCLEESNEDRILQEIKDQLPGKAVTRFISTHPDEDHLQGLKRYNEEIGILNFYVVRNNAHKDEPTESFTEYCKLRDDPQKAFYIFKDCSRYWMNLSTNEIGSAGINILWPVTENTKFKDELKKAEEGISFNNLSPIIELQDGIKCIWMGDMENSYMQTIATIPQFHKIHILFAPHHGRASGAVLPCWLNKMQPELIVIGETEKGKSGHLSYYSSYAHITQFSAGDILFVYEPHMIHIYVSNSSYTLQDCSEKTKERIHSKTHPYRTGMNYFGTLDLIE